jgi:hypothetical protein
MKNGLIAIAAATDRKLACEEIGGARGASALIFILKWNIRKPENQITI